MKILARTSIFLSTLLAMAITPARAETRMQVSAGATPVHTQPSDGSPQVGKANAGEILFVSRLEGDWAAISPPDRFDLWLNQDFIEGNRVIAKSIQVRAGPGVQYDVVCTLERGAPVMPRGESGDWRKIAPPSSATLWVRKKDLSEVRAQTAPIQQVAAVPEPAKPTPEAAPIPAPAPAPKPTPAEPPPPALAPVAASKPGSTAPATVSAPTLATAPAAPVPSAAKPEPVRVAAATPAPAPRPAATPATISTQTASPALRPATAIPAGRVAPRASATSAATTRPPAVRTPVKPAATAPAPVPAPAAAVAAQKSKTVDVAVDQALVDGLDLAEDMPNQGQPVQVEGQLRNAPFLAGSPSRYRLLDRSENGVLEMVCHIHGDSTELRPYVGQGVSIRGREYWVESSDMPVVVVGQIVPLAPTSEPVLF